MKKIMWDKGHGGTDPGAVGNSLEEKDLTHKILEYAMDYLNAEYTGFEQRTTRTGDQTVPLNKRDDGADAWKADVFISVHINAAAVMVLNHLNITVGLKHPLFHFKMFYMLKLSQLCARLEI